VSICKWTSGTGICLPVCGRAGLGCVYLCVDEWDWDVSTCVWTSGTGMCLPVCGRVGL
jgi:hypothetical protein